jgi:hypothetical protein
MASAVVVLVDPDVLSLVRLAPLLDGALVARLACFDVLTVDWRRLVPADRPPLAVVALADPDLLLLVRLAFVLAADLVDDLADDPVADLTACPVGGSLLLPLRFFVRPLDDFFGDDD